MRKRIVPIVAAVLLFGTLAITPANSAVVIKGVSCSSCSQGFKWKPAKVSINKGTKVTWKAVSGTHTVTAISNNWSKNVQISSGGTTSFTFKKTGTFRFRCKFHSTYNSSTHTCSGMCGKVIVS